GVTPILLQEEFVVSESVRPRADDRHVSQENVDQLRELVDGILAQEQAQPCHAIVALLGLRDLAVLASSHRAELVDVERSSQESAAALAEEPRTGSLYPDEQPHAEESGRQDGEGGGGNADVEQPFQHAADGPVRPGMFAIPMVMPFMKR